MSKSNLLEKQKPIMVSNENRQKIKMSLLERKMREDQGA